MHRSILLALAALTAALVAGCSNPEKELKEAKTLDIADAYVSIIDKYPDTPFAREARQCLAELELEAAAQVGTEEAYLDVAHEYQDLEIAAEARERAMTAGWDAARSAGTQAGFESFAERYPGSIYATEAATMAVACAFAAVCDTNTAASYRSFIETYPDSPHGDEAATALEWAESTAAKRRRLENRSNGDYCFRSHTQKVGSTTRSQSVNLSLAGDIAMGRYMTFTETVSTYGGMQSRSSRLSSLDFRGEIRNGRIEITEIDKEAPTQPTYVEIRNGHFAFVKDGARGKQVLCYLTTCR